ncbi:Dicer-like protein 1 [Mortierella polycephala]|uniref:Dicer-like protein 1 n=1 Tax=Mortierella polycephala TaxID=41804 RepID=A0A9P6Q9B9_9FUNG|nr:Dicer-like protein 1 [Mortierella polycephala]
MTRSTFSDAPRKYQLEIARRAIEGNIIAVSDTGSGKTLIAVLLLKHVVAESRKESARTGAQQKVAFFVVNKVPLVFQQHAYISSNSDIKAEAICGAMNVDNYDLERWESIFSKMEVVVLTGQILYNILCHGFLKIENCSLIIFDECHHATKSNCYKLIMTQFYHDASTMNHPKIFGMTASPPKDKGSVNFTATDLERTLDARIVTPSYDEIRHYSKPPVERTVLFSIDHLREIPNAGLGTSGLNSEQERGLDRLFKWCETDKRLKQVVSTHEYAMMDLGPWCAIQILAHVLRGLRDDVLDGMETSQEKRLMDIGRAEGIASQVKNTPLNQDLALVSDKIKKLVQVLQEVSAKDGFCGILFVERRPAVHVLCEFLEECVRFGPEFGLDHIRPVALTGHGSKGDIGRHKMQLKEQRRVLSGFRKGDFNLLVATDVAEEGLDIDRCRFVIRFDSKTTLISHIQSRGRARDPLSEYIIMQQDGAPSSLEIMKQKEADMRVWCGGLSEDRVIKLYGSQDESDSGDDCGLEQMRELAGVATTHIDGTTGARVSFSSAVSLLYQYCGSLPTDSYAQLMPEFEQVPCDTPGKFQYWLTLPSNAPVTDFMSDEFSKRKLAKQSAAFLACVELHRLGALSNRMLPHRRSALDGDSDEDQDEETSGASSGLYPIQQPEFWDSKILTSETTSNDAHGDGTILLYMTRFALQPSSHHGGQDATVGLFRDLCLLSMKPLPQFDRIELFFDGESRWVDMDASLPPINLTFQQVEKLHRYSERLFATLFRKPVDMGTVDVGMRHIVAPLCDDADVRIDWGEIHAGITEAAGVDLQPTELTYDRLQDMALFEKGEVNRLYFPVALRTDLCPSSLIPDSASATVTRESNQGSATFATFYRVKRDRNIVDLTQPLVEVTRMPPLFDHLQPGKKQARVPRASNARFLVPELSLQCPIAASVLRSGSWIISVLNRLDGLLKAKEFADEFNLQSVSLPLVLESLTASDAAYAMNYQRLELLGDTFLKLIVTVDLYIRHPLLDEGRLSAKRTARISNSRLFKHAKMLLLHRFLIRLPPLNTHFFTLKLSEPEHLKAGQEQEQEQEQGSQQAMQNATKSTPQWEISNKTMADLIESTLGAAYLSGSFNLGFEASEALFGPLDGVRCWDDFAEVYNARNTKDQYLDFVPALGYGDLGKVEDAIGYKFTQKHLLAQALTHASYPRPQTPCYQRLEFLGDAVLDMLVAEYWVEKYPISGPGLIHLIKSASVNNQILGLLSIQLGLHQHILHASSTLGADIHRAVQTLEDATEDAKASKDGELVGEYWDGFNFTKVLGDILESVLGAVYVDSGWDFAVVKALFDRAILPTLRKHISMETLKPNPITALIHRVQGDGCQKVTLKNVTAVTGSGSPTDNTLAQQPLGSSSRTTPAPTPMPTCAILIHGTMIVSSTNKTSQLAHREAAKRALALLDEDPTLLDQHCTCARKAGKKVVCTADPDR